MIVPMLPRYMLAVHRLVNVHLTAVVPGWALPADYLAAHLAYDDTEFVTEPWVTDRLTLCAVEGGQVNAVAHLLRYGSGPEVSPSYRGSGTLSWLLCRPERQADAVALLAAAREQFAAWQVTRFHGWDAGLPVPALWGVPDVWPHVAAALTAAGFQPDPRGRHMALYGGRLETVPAPGEPPLPGLRVQRAAGDMDGPRFVAVVDQQEVGACEIDVELSRGGLVPALRGWTQLANLMVRPEWRNRGIGRWLVQHAVAYARLAGCGRLVLDVADSDEAVGAGSFCRRFGWEVFARETHQWEPVP